MSNENLILKIRLLLLAWFHLRSQPGPPSLLKRFSYKDIKKATDGFKRVIQSSSLGASYKAKFQNGHLATVKEVRLSDEDDDSFYREVQLLGRLHHRHIVALCGFSSGSKRFLVFENMEEGSLKEHLSGNFAENVLHCLPIFSCLKVFLVRSSEDSLELENKATDSNWHSCCSGLFAEMVLLIPRNTQEIPSCFCCFCTSDFKQWLVRIWVSLDI
ncbi:UNVERIFIED_CONTAM: putative LRR receptor-like protein kinase [Sesamum radiatum]|uniref:LRR receptor-like protein kinase n=1 Tax=Sesamum radiatum TaxID=300843 RepID=A0AAW2UKV7_SESRA